MNDESNIEDVEQSVKTDKPAQSFYEAVGPKVDGTPKGGWRGIAASNLLGWGWETPVGTVPMGLMEPGEVLDFLEAAEKPWPKEDPRRGEGS